MGIPNKQEIKGKGQKAKGAVKEKVGRALGYRGIEGEGAAEREQGEGREKMGRARRKIGDAIKDVGQAIRK
jgi:uncharacterized protein YjbJ (UPF0337 family)